MALRHIVLVVDDISGVTVKDLVASKVHPDTLPIRNSPLVSLERLMANTGSSRVSNCVRLEMSWSKSLTTKIGNFTSGSVENELGDNIVHVKYAQVLTIFLRDNSWCEGLIGSVWHIERRKRITSMKSEITFPVGLKASKAVMVTSVNWVSSHCGKA